MDRIVTVKPAAVRAAVTRVKASVVEVARAQWVMAAAIGLAVAFLAAGWTPPRRACSCWSASAWWRAG